MRLSVLGFVSARQAPPPGRGRFSPEPLWAESKSGLRRNLPGCGPGSAKPSEAKRSVHCAQAPGQGPVSATGEKVDAL